MSAGKRNWTLFIILGCGATASLFAWAQSRVGDPLDSFRGVVVHENGPVIVTSHGRHFAEDGYYYGQKWQCVEYVKRFFHQAHGHRMPDVWGHAKDFWDEAVAPGAISTRRGLVQHRNGGRVPPLAGDLMVFTNGGYGHVAIVTEVTSNHIEVIQQNIPGRTRDKFVLKTASGTNWVGQGYAPAGWLRLPDRKAEKTGTAR